MLRNNALSSSSPTLRALRRLILFVPLALFSGLCGATAKPATPEPAVESEPAATPEPAEATEPAPLATAADLAVRGAVTAGDAAALRAALAAGGRAEQSGKMGVTLLMTAAEHGQAEIVDLLLAAGAGTKRVTSWNETVLAAAARGGSSKVVASLLAAGAEVNHRAKLGFSPLIVAIGSGHLEIVRQLLAAGADPNQAAAGGTPPLQFAAVQGRVEIARALVAAGARLDAKDEFGRDALALAVDGGHEDTIAFFEQATGRKAVRPQVAQSGIAATEVGEVDFRRFAYRLEGRTVEVREGVRQAAGPHDITVESTSLLLGDLGKDGRREAAILLRYRSPGSPGSPGPQGSPDGLLKVALMVFGIRDGRLVELGRLPEAGAGEGAVVSVGIDGDQLRVLRESPAGGETSALWRLADSGLVPAALP